MCQYVAIGRFNRTLQHPIPTEAMRDAQLCLADEGLIEVGRIMHRLGQPFIPKAVCVTDQVAPIIARQFRKGLPEAIGKITTLRNLTTEIAFNGGIQPPPISIGACIETEARTACCNVTIAGLRVSGRQRNTLNRGRVSRVARIEITISGQTQKPIKTHSGITIRDAHGEPIQAAAQRLIHLGAYRLGRARRGCGGSSSSNNGGGGRWRGARGGGAGRRGGWRHDRRGRRCHSRALRAAFTFKLIHTLLQRVNAPHQIFNAWLLRQGRRSTHHQAQHGRPGPFYSHLHAPCVLRR